MANFKDQTKLVMEVYGEALVETIQAGLAKIGEQSSDLYKSVKYVIKDNSLTVSMNYYAEYIERGRRIGARKVPISALLKWIKEKGLNSSKGANSLAFAIQTSIYQKGIKPRKFMPYAAIDLTTKKMVTELVKVTADEIVATLSNVKGR